MAFSSLGTLGLPDSSLLSDSSFGTFTTNCLRKCCVVEPIGLRLQKKSKFHCVIVFKEVDFVAASWSRSASHCCQRKRRGLGIRCDLQQTGTGADSSESTISVEEARPDASYKQESRDLELGSHPKIDHGSGGGGSSGNAKFPPAGGGGRNGDDDNGHEKNDEKEDDLGPVMKLEDVIRETESKQAFLPSDMLEALKTVGIPKILILRYLDLQTSAGPLRLAMKSCSFLRNRMLADPTFLFKIGTEIVIDSCCATFAEVQRRGKDFWAEFELYAADLLVGLVVNVALVSMLAPYARIGQPSTSNGFFGRMARAYRNLPSSVFEAERPGCRYSVQQRIGTYFYKGLLYGSVGFVCGIVGQGIANMIMTAKRNVKKSDDDVPVPPLLKSAALWGVFLAISSNTRYQIINCLEQLVEASPVGRGIPPLAMAFTVGIRFANNVYGGMQFVDWARWSGVQ